MKFHVYALLAEERKDPALFKDFALTKKKSNYTYYDLIISTQSFSFALYEFMNLQLTSCIIKPQPFPSALVDSMFYM